ncbi:MAG: GLPGLI family protein [Bacteroidota bacterium]
MKKAILTLFTFSIAAVTIAQTQSGKVTYEEIITFKIDLEGEAAQFASMMPKEQKGTKVLHFNQDASIFMSPQKTEDEEISRTTENGSHFKFKIGRADEKAYCDLKKNKKLEQKDFMSRKFLVESDIQTSNWKLTGKQKTILGYPCQEAVKEDSTKKTTVWFTPAIPVSVGPAGSEGLPGLVLAMEANNGEYVLNATSVEAGKEDVALLVKPSEGKKMSREAYTKMVEEKTEEMRKEYGGSGNGNVIIKMRTN